ncbi:DUF1122 family protein [Sulfolobus tengchongensis]|uniref:DUF1122 family protein n=1 Tax=Sulfolobus tengchongensis TaxID=207809 RepID=A0AAX4KZE6_9CREN
MLELNGKRVNENHKLEIKNVRNTHIKELIYFDLFLDDGRLIGKCNYFKGRDYYTPWLEIDYYPYLRNEKAEANLFKVIYNFLPPGGKLFVTYIRDEETRNMLYVGNHPVETPLGFSLLSAGFTWFKDWYFPEGGNEGFQKLQSNKPLNRNEAIRQLEEIKKEVKNQNIIRKVEEIIEYYRKSGDRPLYWQIT